MRARWLHAGRGRGRERGGPGLNAEIIGVGTELLLGQIANTNAQHISAALASIGVDVYFHAAVGDNLDRVVAALRTATGRSDVVVITGGLGPTPDDLTRAAVAAYLERPLRRDERLAQMVAAVFASMGRDMPEDNLRQADLPLGALPIDPEGTAPGFHVTDDGGRLLVALPGVPWEMKAMLAKAVLPLLQSTTGAATIVSRQVLVTGLGESATHQRIADIVAAQSNPSIAYLAGGGLVRVRISAKATDESSARALIAPVEEAIRTRLGSAAVPGEGSTLAQAVGDMLSARGITVGVAESLTGGLIGAAFSATAGSSAYFRGSLVAYARDAKSRVAGVEEAVLEGPGAVSEAAARALAEAAARIFEADLGIAATGVAGPAEQEGKGPGTIYVGATFRGRTEARLVRGYGDRDNVRTFAVSAALDLGRRMLDPAG
ncbi:MAG: competence/damage-inducible protein A [Actinomycetota bacterium]